MKDVYQAALDANEVALVRLGQGVEGIQHIVDSKADAVHLRTASLSQKQGSFPHLCRLRQLMIVPLSNLRGLH